jgi:uncharacterized protein
MSKAPRFYSHYDAPMWASIAEQAMKLQRCSNCGTFRYPPGPSCANCLSVEFTWEKLSGKGIVLSWTTFHRQYLPAYPVPYTVVAVQLTEGPILLSNVEQADVGKLKLDAPVELFYGTHPDGYALPRCRLT